MPRDPMTGFIVPIHLHGGLKSGDLFGGLIFLPIKALRHKIIRTLTIVGKKPTPVWVPGRVKDLLFVFVSELFFEDIDIGDDVKITIRGYLGLQQLILFIIEGLGGDHHDTLQMGGPKFDLGKIGIVGIGVAIVTLSREDLKLWILTLGSIFR